MSDARYVMTHVFASFEDVMTHVFASFEDVWRNAARIVLEDLDRRATPADVRARIIACVVARDYAGAVAVWDEAHGYPELGDSVGVLTDEELTTLAESKR